MRVVLADDSLLGRLKSRVGHSSNTLRLLRRSLWLVGLAAGIAVLVPTVSREGLRGLEAIEILGVLVGWSFTASGLVIWARRPGNRLGPLMVVVGLAWLVGWLLTESPSSLLFTAGVFLSDAWVVLFVLFLVAFPSGRLRSRRDALLVAPFVLAFVVLELPWLLFFDPGESPGNALLVWPNAGVADAIDVAERAIGVAGAIILTGVLARRWLAASPPLRRVLIPILAGSVSILLSASRVVLDRVTGRLELVEAIELAVLAAVPLAVMAGLLRARLARSAVGDIFVELREAHAAADVRDALARALGDPSLALAFWVPQYQGYVDVDGLPTALPGEGSGRVATIVERGERQVAALVHDESLREEPELVGAVSAAAGIALENERLQAELRARLEELRGSRARIVEAGDAERRRLERDLHDGAQQRLVSLTLALDLAKSRLSADTDTQELVGFVRGELAHSLEELREVAHGIHPGIVSDHGLEVALESVAARAPVPVRVAVELEERPSEPVEVAAYYVVCEALTNVAKYAQASAASVEASRVDGRLVVEVSDDGIGGADTSSGSGLRGLADRVEALGGHLRVWSPAGAGTRIRADIPCA